VSAEADRIAAALRRSPVYVDPAYAKALPAAGRDALVRRIRRSSTPVYVVLAPIVAGGTWQSSEQLATVVRSHLNRDGAYVTLNADFGDVFDVVMWGGTDATRRSAHDAGWAVSYEKRYDKAPLAARLGRCVELIANGQGTQAYEKESGQALGSDRSSSPSPTARPSAHDDGLPLGVPIAVAAVAAAAGALVWLRHRRARVAVERLRLPRTVFGTGREADLEELRARAERELVAFGESLDGEDDRPANLARALDAYAAAGRTLDGALTAADLAGVLALVNLGRGAAPLCYFDPRHGAGTNTVGWRAPGTRTKRTVKACPACAGAVRDRRAPEVLLDGGRPYYERAGLWAETGFGQFGDVVGRILDE
jgi:hypothetical protein